MYKKIIMLSKSLINKVLKKYVTETKLQKAYNDYPKSAQNNACKVLGWIDKYGRDEVKGMTRTGLARANQLCNKENISEDTIARMAAFERHRKNAMAVYGHKELVLLAGQQVENAKLNFKIFK